MGRELLNPGPMDIPVETVKMANLNAKSGTVEAYRYGRLVVVRFFYAAYYYAWQEGTKLVDLTGITWIGVAESSLYAQDYGRCLQVYGSGNSIYIRNKNSVAMDTWFIGQLVGFSST